MYSDYIRLHVHGWPKNQRQCIGRAIVRGLALDGMRTAEGRRVRLYQDRSVYFGREWTESSTSFRGSVLMFAAIGCDNMRYMDPDSLYLKFSHLCFVDRIEDILAFGTLMMCDDTPLLLTLDAWHMAGVDATEIAGLLLHAS